jgi:hypothetical protein
MLPQRHPQVEPELQGALALTQRPLITHLIMDHADTRSVLQYRSQLLLSLF